jgi:hypothetical protein
MQVTVFQFRTFECAASKQSSLTQMAAVVLISDTHTGIER